MKKLIVKLLEQLQVWQKNPQESPKELENIVNEVKICSKDYVKLPAYIAYRAVGMYEFNSDRLHKKISN